MAAATFSAEALLDLALDEHSSLTTRIVLLSAERATTEGVARFDSGELLELLRAGGRTQPVYGKQMRSIIRSAIRLGHIREGSTHNRILLPLDRIKPRGDGLRVLRDVDARRVLAACDDCEHRAIYAADYLASEAATCPKCRRAAAAA